MRCVIRTEKAPTPVGPYSQAIAAEELIFLSGQLGIDPSTGALVQGGVREQATRCLENVKALLEASGSDLSQVVKVTVFVVDMSQFKEVNEAYASFFKVDPPARTTVGVASLPLGAKVEIEVVAIRAHTP